MCGAKADVRYGPKNGHSAVCYAYKKYQIASDAPAIKTTTRITACRANFEPASAITKTIRPMTAPNTIIDILAFPVFWPKAGC
jgi:hypothetical protein